MDLQDPKIQKLLFSSLIGAAILYVFFGTTMVGFTYPSQKATTQVLQDEHEKLSRELERARLIVGNMAKLEREFEYLHRQWTVAQSLLPEENEMSPLLRQITAAGTQSGLEFVRFEPQPSIGQGFYTENPIEVEVEGGYHQVGSFVSLMANMDRIINVRNLSLEGVKPEKQGDEDIRHTVTATMQIVSYSIDTMAPIGGADMGAADTQISSAAAHNNAPTLAASESVAGGSK